MHGQQHIKILFFYRQRKYIPSFRQTSYALLILKETNRRHTRTLLNQPHDSNSAFRKGSALRVGDVDLPHFLSTSRHCPLYVSSRRSYIKGDQVTTFLSRTSWWHNYIQNIECVWKLSDSCTGDYCVAQRSSNHASRSLMCPRAVVRCVARYLTIHDATQYQNTGAPPNSRFTAAPQKICKIKEINGSYVSKRAPNEKGP